MAKKLNREKQAEVLRRTQAQRKEQKREQVLKAIQELQKQKKPLTFKNIATVAGCSVSYLYKWDNIKAYIHDLQNKKAGQLNQLEEKEPGPHSLKTLHEVSKQRIRELEDQNQELKRQNEKLRGHVAEIFELRDECERLRAQLRQLTLPETTSKVIPLHSPSRKPQTPETIPSTKLSIEQELEQLGITLNGTLKKTLKAASEETVFNAIEALKEQLNRQEIPNPGGWLNKAIKEGWTKAEKLPEQRRDSQPEVLTPTVQEDRELISPDELGKLSQLFKEKANDR